MYFKMRSILISKRNLKFIRTLEDFSMLIWFPCILPWKVYMCVVKVVYVSEAFRGCRYRNGRFLLGLLFFLFDSNNTGRAPSVSGILPELWLENVSMETVLASSSLNERQAIVVGILSQMEVGFLMVGFASSIFIAPSWCFICKIGVFDRIELIDLMLISIRSWFSIRRYCKFYEWNIIACENK